MRIEFILRESTIDDVINSWIAAGNADNSGDGGFIFENAADYNMSSSTICVISDGSTYIYNLSDFYRIKITGQAKYF